MVLNQMTMQEEVGEIQHGPHQAVIFVLILVRLKLTRTLSGSGLTQAELKVLGSGREATTHLIGRT